MTEPPALNPWLPLAGVALGFMLGEGSRLVRYWWEVRRNKRPVRAELRAVLAQLPQKVDILNQAISALRAKRLLPTRSVHVVASGYQTVLSDLYPHLNVLERNCLHVIYERLRIGDEFMDTFERDFLESFKTKLFDDAWTVFADKADETKSSFLVVEELARSYIAGRPIDVFTIEHRAP